MQYRRIDSQMVILHWINYIFFFKEHVMPNPADTAFVHINEWYETGSNYLS